MSELKEPDPVKFFIAALVAGRSVLPALKERLQDEFGSIDFISEMFDFDVTDYYAQEMGSEIKRVFYSFAALISPGDLAEIRVRAGRLEQSFSDEGRRIVNLDPGYMDYFKIVLASGKFQGQKIYLGKGVFADLTLYYDRGWHSYPWGFPDFKSGRYDHALTRIRELYRAARRSGGVSGQE